MSTIQSSSKSHIPILAANGTDFKFLVWSSTSDPCSFSKYLWHCLNSLRLAPVLCTMTSESSKSSIKARLEADKPTHVFAIIEDLADYAQPEDPYIYMNPSGETIHIMRLVEQCCQEMNIHCTLFMNGNLYEYDENHECNDPNFVGFTEEDTPNHEASDTPYISYIAPQERKRLADSNLVFRLRFPVFEVNCQDNYIAYMLSKCRFMEDGEKNWKLECGTAINTPNSYSVLFDLLPAAIYLATHKAKGNFNLVNPGTMLTRDILYMLAEEMDPMLFHLDLWLNKGWFLGDQGENLLDDIPNCRLSTTKLTQTLCEYGYRGSIPDVKEACRASIARMKAVGETLTGIHALLEVRFRINVLFET